MTTQEAIKSFKESVERTRKALELAQAEPFEPVRKIKLEKLTKQIERNELAIKALELYKVVE